MNKESSIDFIRGIVKEYDELQSDLDYQTDMIAKIADAIGFSSVCIPSSFIHEKSFGDCILAILKEANINAFDLDRQIKDRKKRMVEVPIGEAK